MDKLHALSRCQHCSTKLIITGLEDLPVETSLNDKQAELASASASLGASSMVGARLDESFIVLDPSKQARPGLSGRLEESFLMVPGSASVIRQGAAQQLQASTPAYVLENVDDKFQQLARIFEIASGETRVDHPLCLECAGKVREEVEGTLAEIEAETAAYQAGLEQLEREIPRRLSPEALEAELREAEAELHTEEENARQADAELAQAESELRELRDQAKELDGLEEQYWHAANHLSLSLRLHAQQRTSIQRKIWQSEEQLQGLQATNVYNNIFNISHDGPFGTISGFRLGRTSSCPVEWDEINAAWGQAVLLLHTMAQSCKLTFSGYRLHPMGSYSKIADKKGTMNLFGPANKFYCTTYDRAMVSFLACLKEFFEFAQSWDRQEGRTPLEMVYAIDGDLVGNQSIKLMFSNTNKWTGALKYMLANLKWALAWMIATQNKQILVKQNAISPTPAAMRSSA